MTSKFFIPNKHLEKELRVAKDLLLGKGRYKDVYKFSTMASRIDENEHSPTPNKRSKKKKRSKTKKISKIEKKYGSPDSLQQKLNGIISAR